MPRKRNTAGPDWQKIARERLHKLNNLERQCAALKTQLADELYKEMTAQFHAHCIPRNVYEGKLHAIAEFVAERVRPQLHGR